MLENRPCDSLAQRIRGLSDSEHLGREHRACARRLDHARSMQRRTFTSRDYRLGLAVGKMFCGFAAPFVVGRYFGAGTSPEVGGHGGDHYRYHVGVGSAFGLSRHFDSLVELAFLGEKRATLGLGYVF